VTKGNLIDCDHYGLGLNTWGLDGPTTPLDYTKERVKREQKVAKKIKRQRVGPAVLFTNLAHIGQETEGRKRND